ncbi:MAG: hypothetical protein V7K21_20175 [Nostoc sp.]|uniref:hypothetical protein n=1 Tax=Nostoc sp. TaxID=1180 RepID=UPI002FF6E6CB
MMLHLSTAKYNSLIVWKTYLNPGEGVPGVGNTPLESFKNWLTNCSRWINQYKEKEISLSKFAEFLGVSIYEAAQILEAENVEINLGVLSKADLVEDDRQLILDS